MPSKTAIVCNETGIHARPASDFVRAAKTFSADVTIKNITDGGGEANAKSMIEVLALGMSEGHEVEVSAVGTDEQLAVDTLIGMIESGFEQTYAAE